MPQADVLQLVTDLSDGLADATAATNFYSDIVFLMGTDVDGTLTNIQTVANSIGPVSNVTSPATTITELLVIYEDTELDRANPTEVTAFNPYWRATIGEPRVWMQEDRPKHLQRILPNPSRPQTGQGGALPLDPTTTDPGFGATTFIYTETRTDVHPEEELALALEIIAREFARDSDHTDRNLAQACRSLSGVFFRMIALAISDRAPAFLKALEEDTEGEGG
jgi:hypothetical protein